MEGLARRLRALDERVLGKLKVYAPLPPEIRRGNALMAMAGLLLLIIALAFVSDGRVRGAVRLVAVGLLWPFVLDRVNRKILRRQ